MLAHVDNLLRRLFIDQVPSITSETQVRFQPPDQEWRTVVSNLGVRNALNVYLVELRENRALRTNERVRELDDGVMRNIPGSSRVDCHYLITAWSPATVTPAVEPTADEHALLYDVIAVLMNHTSLVPREVYAPNPLPAGFPLLIADSELPATLLPVEGFPKYAEFWGTMGNIHPWKPAVYLVVTIPVALKSERDDSLVTTSIANAADEGAATIHIGGTVFDASVNPATPIAAAWVRLYAVQPTGIKSLQTTEANVAGRFMFKNLTPGKYRLRVSVVGLGEKLRDVDVPSPTGEYNVQFP